MALSRLPSDANKRLFVEQQLRAIRTQGDWLSITDPRPPGHQQDIVQVPKWWSCGNCNLALLSYAHDGSWLSVSASRWTDVDDRAAQLIATCLEENKQGGAITVNNVEGTASLSLFLWQDGAPFDNVMNQYMSANYPAGIDPITTEVSVLNSSNSADLSFSSGPAALDSILTS
ncbi:hypothetical protein ACLMJK_001428 [Lecanora helva]